jgi:hypothetical protein
VLEEQGLGRNRVIAALEAELNPLSCAVESLREAVDCSEAR